MGNKALNIVLCVPRVQFGKLTLGNSSGLDNALRPYMRGNASTTPSSTRYPLRIPDRTTVSVPMELPMVGETVIGLGYAQELLWLGLPNMPMVMGFILPKLNDRMAPGVAPRMIEATVYYPLTIAVGERAAVPLLGFGEIAIEVTA